MPSSLIAQALAIGRASGVPAEPIAVPAPFAGREADGTRLATTFARLAGATFRGTTMVSPRVIIDNLLVLPDPSRAAPVFALERVVVGSKVMVLVIDLPVLAPGADSSSVAGAARDLWAGYPDLPSADDPSDWWREARSGWDLFSKPRGDDAVLRSTEAALAAWALWLKVSAEAPPSAQGHGEAIARYLANHAAHFPGRPFLHRAFGETWSEDFLAFLHAPPG